MYSQKKGAIAMLSEALRLIRVFHDLKQGELAKRIGISNSYLSEIENGQKKPSLDLLKKYETVFNIPVSSIIFFSENLKETKPSKTHSYISSKIINFLKFIERNTESANV